MTIGRDERILGGLYGLLVGDALGVPYEFSEPGELPPREQLELVPPPGFERAHAGAPVGAWSDDGAQALCLLASLLDRGRLELEDFARRLLNWLDHGYMAVDYLVFDCGIQTAQALGAIRGGVPVERAAGAEERHNGNGSLMRALPLALWHRGTDDELIQDAADQSVPTHAHVRSQVVCALYCLWARALLEERPEPWSHATAVLRRYCEARPVWRDELEQHVQPDRAPGGKGSGYVVDCLHSARFACREETFEGVVRAAISLGHDTDTTATVAGGIAGLRHGAAGIPARWLEGLSGRALVEPLAERLLERWR